MTKARTTSCRQELERTTQRLEDFSLQTRHWFWETDACHIFIYFSESLEQLTDLKIKDLVGTSRLDIALSKDTPAWREHASALINHQPFTDFRYARENKSGDLRHLVVSGWPITDENGKFAGYRGTGRDETDEVMAQRKQAERESHLVDEVKRHRKDLNAVLENMTQSIMLFDSDGNIFLNNARTAYLLGFTQEEYKPVANIRDHLRLMARRGDFGDVDIEAEVEKRAHRLCKGQKSDTSYRIHLASLNRYLLVTLTPLADGSRILTHTDVTSEAVKERELNEREEVLSTLINNIDYGVLFMDKDLRAEVINDRFAEIWNMDQSVIAGNPSFAELMATNRYTGIYSVDGNDEEAWNAYVAEREKAARKGNIRSAELALGDGRYFDYSVVNLPGGRRMATYFDITERKQMEVALEERVEQRTKDLVEAQRSLVEQSRKALLGDLVASLCHELRNPLNALNASLFVIHRKVADDYPNLEKTFDRSSRTIERCTSILNDLYDFALTHQFNAVEMDLDEWLHGFLHGFDMPAEINLTIKASSQVPACLADADHLSKAFGKILRNAVLAVTANRADGDEPQIEIRLEDAGGRIELSVRDNGPGMSDEVRAKAFEPLYSTRGFGVGLGLPIARQVMKRHGGGIELNTLEGEGTTVTLWLPYSRSGLSKAA